MKKIILGIFVVAILAGCVPIQAPFPIEAPICKIDNSKDTEIWCWSNDIQIVIFADPETTDSRIWEVIVFGDTKSALENGVRYAEKFCEITPGQIVWFDPPKRDGININWDSWVNSGQKGTISHSNGKTEVILFPDYYQASRTLERECHLTKPAN